jgi:lipopolysaccharide transport system ATP-binding protein
MRSKCRFGWEASSYAEDLEPKILFVDEALAVGDTAFQRKCLGKMGDAARKGAPFCW